MSIVHWCYSTLSLGRHFAPSLWTIWHYSPILVSGSQQMYDITIQQNLQIYNLRQFYFRQIDKLRVRRSVTKFGDETFKDTCRLTFSPQLRLPDQLWSKIYRQCSVFIACFVSLVKDLLRYGRNTWSNLIFWD